MGNCSSTQSRLWLSAALPPLHDHGLDDDKRWTDKGFKAFANEQDRDQFVHAVMAVISHNGSLDLAQHKFQLLYSRRKNDRLVATLVATKDGIINAKIEPAEDGKDRKEAFKAFKKDVERRLQDLLEDVPSAVDAKLPPRTATTQPDAIGSPSSPRSPTRASSSVPVTAPPARTDLIDAPPAYEAGSNKAIPTRKKS